MCTPGMETNRNTSQIPGRDEDCGSNCNAGDPHAMGYMEHMNPHGYFPNYCYGPYPPPPFARYDPVYMGMQPMYMPMVGVSYFVSSSHDQTYAPHYYEHSSADLSMSRASRKSRTARRRVHESEELGQPRSIDRKPSRGAQAAVLAGNHENATDPPVPSAGQQGREELDSKGLMFLLAKQLSPSGVSSLGRIVLPKKEAEAHLPHLVASEGLLLTMADFDTHQNWTFRYRFWSNNKSRMYLLENTRDFVKAHNLQERDMLILYKDAEGRYVVRGERNGANTQTCEVAVANEVPTTEEEISRKEQTLEFLI